MLSQYVLEVSGTEVILTPDAKHEYLATTEQVAKGYGVSVEAIRSHKSRQAEELREGKHFLTVANCDAQAGRGAQTQTLWTKRGIVRLGFFIKSPRAKLFRDLAEDLVVNSLQPTQPASPLALAETMLHALKQQDTRIQVLEEWKDTAPINSAQIAVIHRLGQQLGHLIGFASAWNLFKRHFNLASYRDLPSTKFEEAKRFLELQIASYNGAQGVLL